MLSVLGPYFTKKGTPQLSAVPVPIAATPLTESPLGAVGVIKSRMDRGQLTPKFLALEFFELMPVIGLVAAYAHYLRSPLAGALALPSVDCVEVD